MYFWQAFNMKTLTVSNKIISTIHTTFHIPNLVGIISMPMKQPYANEIYFWYYVSDHVFNYSAIILSHSQQSILKTNTEKMAIYTIFKKFISHTHITNQLAWLQLLWALRCSSWGGRSGIIANVERALSTMNSIMGSSNWCLLPSLFIPSFPDINMAMSLLRVW